MNRKVAMIGLLVMAAAAQAAAAVPPAEAEMPAAAAHWWRTWWVWGACAALALAGCVWAWRAAHRRGWADDPSHSDNPVPGPGTRRIDGACEYPGDRAKH